MFKRIAWWASIWVVVAGFASTTRADAAFGDIPDRVQLMLGGTAAELATGASLTSDAIGAGTAIDFESLFDIPGSDQAVRLDGYWRMTGRSYLDFGYVQFNRSGSRQLTEDVTWGDYTLQSGALVTGAFDSRFPYLAYRYDFLQEDKVRISGSAGLSYLSLEPSLSGNGGVIGPDGPITGAYELKESVSFPVPLVGMRLDWVLHRRLTTEWFVRFFRINAAGFNGGMRESSVRLKWHFSKNVGAALGFDSTSIDIKEFDTGDATAKFNYDITGVSLYLTLAF